MNYQLAPARIADARRIAVMSRELIEVGLNPSWPEARVIAHIRHRESVVLVARAAGWEMAGFAIMQFGEHRAHLNLLAVAPRHQRRGVARQLLAWLEESALTAGTFGITLELRAANAAGHAFYAALGYREVERIGGYYERIEDAIRMARDVRPGHVYSQGARTCAR
jgi:[ribosomal protein S18]-alanine N-acetyltransferase